MTTIERLVDEAIRLARLQLAGTMTQTEARSRFMSFRRVIASQNGRHSPPNGRLNDGSN